MTAWAAVALVLAGSFLTAVAAGRRLARSAAAMPTAAAFGDPDEMAAKDRERDRLGREADAARLLAELRRAQ